MLFHACIGNLGRDFFFIDTKQGLVRVGGGGGSGFSWTLNAREEAEEKEDIVTDICVLKKDIFVFHYTYTGNQAHLRSSRGEACAGKRESARVRARE